MRFLIAGLGSIGHRHLNNLLALGERDILLYRSHHRAGQADSLPNTPSVPDLPVETDLTAALAWHPDAVIISNPTALHLDVAIPAARAGCHLLIEKPISHSLERLDQLQAVVAQSGSQVLVGYQFRYHPGLLKIVELLATGAIGRPLSVRSHWGEYLPGWHPWEDYRQGYSARADLGGGVVLTLSHPLDYLRWILGEVATLWAFTAQISDLELDVEDIAEIGLRFQSGVIGSLHLDYYQRPSAHHLEISGTHGVINWDNSDGVVSVHSVMMPDAQFSPPPGFERNDLFMAQTGHFIDICRGKSQPGCTLQGGVRALELSLAALESSASGQSIRFN